jgi:5-methylcytosine-specific restriction endonuclease McrA
MRAGAWYKSKRWKTMRAAQLARKPFCECRVCAGKFVRAEVADHRQAHRGDPKLFFDAANLMSLTKQHHDSWKQRLEKSGLDVIDGGDEFGNPFDPNDPWYELR